MYIHNKIYLLIGDWFSVLKIKETTTFYISVFYKEKKPTKTLQVMGLYQGFAYHMLFFPN